MSKQSEPARLSHQKASGMTTRFCFSVAHHWTKNLEKKTTFPSQPRAFQKLHSMPRNLSWPQSQFASQSIVRGFKAVCEAEDKYNQFQVKARRSKMGILPPLPVDKPAVLDRLT